MRMQKLTVVMMIGSVLVLALGFAGCGDDNDEMSECEKALEQFNSQDCRTQASAAVDGAQQCVLGCDVNAQCLDDCMNSFEDDISACLPETAFLFDQCGNCYSNCGEALVSCLANAQNDAGDCLNTLRSCVNGC